MKKIFLLFGLALLCLFAKAQTGQQNQRPAPTAQQQAKTQKIKELYAMTDSVALQKNLTALINSDKQEDIDIAYTYYASQKRHAKAVEVLAIGAKKFPESDLAFLYGTSLIDDEADLTKKTAMLRTVVKKFPDKDVTNQAYTAAMALAEKGEAKQVTEISAYANPKMRSAVYMNAALKLAETNPKEAEPILKGLFDSTLAAKASADASEPKRNGRDMSKVLSVAYIRTLIDNKKGEAAYAVAKPLYDQPGGQDMPVKVAYTEALIASGRMKDALPLAEEVMKEGEATTRIVSRFADVYKAVKGTSDGAIAYQQQLLKMADDKLMAEMAGKAVNDPASGFTLQDVDGKAVSLNELKGKVVVLDFWATWCGPCKASFPMMQKAVNKYKADANVAFLFIHTMDISDGDPTKDAKKYVTDNKYSFEVLMDLRDKISHKSAVADAYDITGIPTKIIIDPKGNICFKVTGFNSDVEKGMKEVSAMIEYAKSKG